MMELQDAMLGPVLTPADAGYDGARAIWNALYDRRPAVIAQCMGVADVQAAVAYARANDLAIAVRSAGHSMSGASTTEGGLLIDLRLMRGVRVDPEQRTAASAAGTTWGEFDRETQVHGLACPGGFISVTGVAGLTLGGGVGRLSRRFGLACDNVLSFDVVTADGSWLHVDAESHPDLFWALRGGGGDFGIVTHLEHRVHPLGPKVFGGFLAWPLEEGSEVLSQLKDEIDNASEALHLQWILLMGREQEQIPPALRGRPMLMLIATWTGEDRDEGKRLLAPFQERIAPTLNFLFPAPYAELQRSSDVQVPPGRRTFTMSGYLDGLTDEVIDTFATQASALPTDFSVMELYQLGGAVARVRADETAIAFREAPYFYVVDSTWDDPAEDEAMIGWVRSVDEAFAPVRRYGRYLNLASDNDPESVRYAYGEPTYARLNEVKTKYDPDGVFSRNPNALQAAAPA